MKTHPHMMWPSPDSKTLLSGYEEAVVRWAQLPADVDPDGEQLNFEQKNAARLAVEVFVGELEAEITARGKLYGEMCGILHDCCQKYKLGLGGENIAELVTEEVARLRDYMRYGYNMDEARLKGMRGDA